MMQIHEERKSTTKEIVRLLFQKGVMLDRQLMNRIDGSDIFRIKEALLADDFVFSKENFETLLRPENPNEDPITSSTSPNTDPHKNNTQVQENAGNNIQNIAQHIDDLPEKISSTDNRQRNDVFSSIKIISTYTDLIKKKDVQSFVKYFNARYKTIRAMLQQRTELSSIQSIKRILEKKEKETVSALGLVFDKRTTKNGNIVLEMEDPTGNINVIINKDKKDVFELAKNVVFDEVIGVTGSNGDKAIFANNIIIPDVQVGREFKKAEDEVYAVVLSDLHVGSKFFLEHELKRFTQWLRGDVGNEKQKEIAKKVKYIFIAGDLVDGVGIYPSQQKELVIDDIYAQYNECARLLKEIPQHLPIIIIAGNHDAMRLSEPQPMLYKDYAKALWELPNVMMLTNPAYINIHASENFPGFDILLYHGYSFSYYADNVESIRQKRPNISERADLVQKFLLQRRHLSPSHSATLYVQDEEKDPLIIDKVPDIFISGHIHRAAVSTYRNVTMISGSCFQTKTPFQEKVGHVPEPGKIPLINLQTREVKILNFSIEKEEQELEKEAMGG